MIRNTVAIISTMLMLIACATESTETGSTQTPSPAPLPFSIPASNIGTGVASTTAPVLSATAIFSATTDTVLVDNCQQNVLNGCVSGTSRFNQATNYTYTPTNPRNIKRDIQGEWITTEVTNAWAQGWTGKGIEIAVADDFAIDETGEFYGSSNTFTIGGFTFTETWSIPLTHGYIVSLIAGSEWELTYQYEIETSSDIINDADSGNNPHCGTTYYCRSSYHASGSFTESGYFGIAAEAKITEFDVLTEQSYLAYSQTGFALDLRNYHILNLSLGASANAVNGHLRDFYLNSLNHAETQDSEKGTLIVKAAGNDNIVAEQGRVNQGLMASNYADSTLIVGALKSENNQTKASYSNTAGQYADNFVVDTGTTGIAGVEGTSFAAPRVAGKAAIIMQKFDTLKARDIANLIKQTADDLGFPGVDPIYGHGRVNLSKALSPVGNLR